MVGGTARCETLGESIVVAYAAHQDAMACLGANLRGEPLADAVET